MKKLMKKKVKIFGREISVFLIAMIAIIGVGSAALVPYLSNMVTGDVQIDSPFQAHIKEGILTGSDTFDSNSIEVSAVGGDTVETTIKFQYTGDRASVNVSEIYMINNSLGIACEDFADILFDAGNGQVSVMDLGFCSQNGDNSIILSDRGFNIYDQGESNIINVWLKFKLNAYGDYNMSAQIVPNTGSN